jgi:hypothetical protein
MELLSSASREERYLPMPDDTDYSKLIPELLEWNNGAGIDVDSWLGIEGDFQLAIAFSRLFWPAFAEHDGCVLFAGFSPTVYQDFLAACDDDRAGVEAVMNHQHLLDLFCHASATATAAQLIYLGKVLRDIVKVKLAHDFPQRVFEVEFDEGPFDDLYEYQVTFWQPANRPTV